jgi:hypothetical protein
MNIKKLAIKTLILETLHDPHLDSVGNINVTFEAYLIVWIKCNVTDNLSLRTIYHETRSFAGFEFI